MQELIIEKFEVRKSDKHNWDIVGIADHWTIKGFMISRRGNYFYIVKKADSDAIDEQSKKNTAYKISAASMAEVVHDYWVLDGWKPSELDLDPFKLSRSLEVNFEAIRQLWINAFWNLKPSLKFTHTNKI